MRQTVDFAIDLGATNSAIAVFNGKDADIFKNNEDEEFTPSAVWIDGKDKLYVGRLAKERLEYDSENTKCDFIHYLGESHVFKFARSGRQMKSEELTAEVIKSLRGDVQQHSGEEVIAAVIAVPVAFELPQAEAIYKAARLAGLKYTRLILKPVAAAVAYGLGTRNNGTTWMVCELGNSTFDVAIVKLENNEIKLITHYGDNEFGIKNISHDIVEKVFIPAVIRDHLLPDFNSGNPKYKAAIAKLKFFAEKEEIRLNREKETAILIDPLCLDLRSNPVAFEYNLTRQELYTVYEPYIEKAENVCKKTMEMAGLSFCDIEKVIPVCEVMISPFIIEQLSNRLNIPFDFNLGLTTAVLRGAAIYAGSVRVPDEISGKYQAI